MKIVSLILTVLCLAACQPSPYEPLGTHTHAICGGTADTLAAHSSVAAVLMDGGMYCTGTLITDNVVLTAAHCCDQTATKYDAYFGPNINQAGTTIAVTTKVIHEDFAPSTNDLCLLWLTQDAPATITRTPILPKAIGLTTADNGADVDFSGFGQDDSGKYGVKLHMTGPITTVCEGPSSCGYSKPAGSFYYKQEDGGPWGGDSGGPAFILRNNVEYVAGVTSGGSASCSGSWASGISMTVSYYADWIEEKLGGVAHETNCGNGVDDDGDGDVDCDDADCTNDPACKPTTETSCVNGADDDGDGDVDCDDSDCTSNAACQPATETNCNNGIDDDADGMTDCVDNNCAASPACNPEVCTGGIDEDGDGAIDCNDVDCTGNAACEHPAENCTNGQDDDGDGSVDCNDADCGSHAACQQSDEICNNTIDDDGDSYADCNDVDCANHVACQTTAENCFNQQDDDGDGKVDCADPDCVSAAGCKSQEICDNNVDDNGNGSADCLDPACATYSACQQKDSSGGCAQAGATGSPAFLLFAAFGLVGWLRRR